MSDWRDRLLRWLDGLLFFPEPEPARVEARRPRR